MPHFFVTGFPGFLCTALVDHLLATVPTDVSLTCLVQPRYRAIAEQRADALADEHPQRRGPISLVDGDITRPDLGLGDGHRALQDTVSEVYHLAAAYDLSVPAEMSRRVNVRGTRHVLDFAAGMERLSRFHHVSTCYVSGHFPGLFEEEQLVEGQIFHNAYERSKYLAEVEVRARMVEGLPATIYRPSIVVGDSHTGVTQKYDGPYYVIRWLLRWRGIAPVPVTGDLRRYHANVVPRDYVVEALTYLSRLDRSVGRTYHLADPSPMTANAMLRLLAEVTERRVLRLRLPARLVKAVLRPRLVQQWTQFDPAILDYFTHPTTYATDDTEADLAGSGITCPPFASYAHRLVDFVRANPDMGTNAMV